MTENEALAQAAERYRRDGYEVVVGPPAEDLPEALRRRYPSLIARRNGTAVLVEVWTRGELHDPPPDPMPSGWNYEAILLPRDEPTAVPGPGPAATPEFTTRLLTELEDYVPRAAHSGRFLLAWAALESAMRVAARREGIDSDRLPPRQLTLELVSAGLLSQDQAGTVRDLMTARNRLIHGTPTDLIGEQAVSTLVGIARGLLSVEATRAGA